MATGIPSELPATGTLTPPDPRAEAETVQQSLCESCERMRAVITPRGSRFLLCRLSASDAAYPKYPRQPVVECAGYVLALQGEASDQSSDPDETPED